MRRRDFWYSFILLKFLQVHTPAEAIQWVRTAGGDLIANPKAADKETETESGCDIFYFITNRSGARSAE